MTFPPLHSAMVELIRELQDAICQAVEEMDGGARFREDPWERAGGGGGRTRVLEEGRVFEKAAVNTSSVYGELGEAFAQRVPGDGRSFMAAGISLIIHPRNPHVPTTHANFRHIVHGQKAWFGGGADLTPYYLYEEDAQHFHRTLRAACDKHDPTYYPRFKKTCDSYFWLKHRGEARGVGGLFFEDLGGEPAREFALVQELGRAVLPAYLPIVSRRKDAPYGEAQRAWQEQRRGRYVEFNLLYDRGTGFGLETGGRVESILVSLPPRVRWSYDVQPASGTEEARLLEVVKHPRDWA
jgi:coproporphyrinogen III oxidase